MNKQFEDHQIWGECYDNTDEVLLQTTCLPIAMYFNVSKQLYTDDSQIALYDSLSLLWPESKCHPILILTNVIYFICYTVQFFLHALLRV